MVKDEQESFSMLIIAVRGDGREVVDRVRMSAVSPTNEKVGSYKGPAPVDLAAALAW